MGDHAASCPGNADFGGLVALPPLLAPAISQKMDAPTPRPRISRRASRTVPTLFRFVAFLAILGGLVFGGMVTLVTFVQPVPREMVETVPPSRLQPK